MRAFSVSIIIPTYNSARTLKECLDSISSQNYNKDLLEILIIDAGSTDNTLFIARGYTDKIFSNPLKTGEAGKAVGVKVARNEIIALIDSDNILIHPEWLNMMTEPFKDREIIGAEPIEYTWRRTDGLITRYCSLIGMNDPLCMFIGNYDRWNHIKNRWTDSPVIEKDMGSYIKVELNKTRLPTIGANGFLARREAVLMSSVTNYLFDIDMVWEFLHLDYKVNGIPCYKFAKVKTGIVHIFSGDIRSFYKKQKRRINDYIYFEYMGNRKYPWKAMEKRGLFTFIIYTILLFPLLFQILKGYAAKRDSAWLFHPIACAITLWVYGFYSIKGKIFKPKEITRKNWSQ